MAVLKIENLSKTYKSRKVVQDVSLEVESGEIIGLLGPNGAGKTTSFYMIVGLVKSEGGSIFLGTEDLTKFPIDVRARKGLGYLPQESSIFRKMTVEQNIMSVLELNQRLSESERVKKLDQLLSDFHVSHLRNEQGVSLSGGERRRVEIARSLATDPLFILLDEPFAGVDPISVGDIQSIVQKLKEAGIGVLITDHNVQETLRICDRAYIVNEGRIISEGSAETVMSDDKVRSVYLGESFSL
tara:strand:- start:66 stop:791 length:726 start_codon:yes stop_codon:yes gene_type:complete